MKKIITMLAAAMLLITGCSSVLKQEDNGRINITCVNFPQYDFAKNIAGDSANVKMLLPPGSESHTFEPSPQDIISLQHSDLFIYTGGESDNWVDEILKTMKNDNMEIIRLLEVCDALDEEYSEGMQAEEHENEHEKDEHIWTSPVNALKICGEIKDRLAKIDSSNADAYEKNFSVYSDKLSALDSKFREIVSGAKRKTLVFGDRFPFRYFVEEYGLDYYAAFPGCAEETEASISTVAFLVDKVRAEQIPVVFYTEFSDHRLADTIAAEGGAKPMRLNSCHNVTADQFKSGIGYIDLMEENTKALEEALY